MFYYSERITEIETKYHSYELEYLALVYVMKRLHIILIELCFKYLLLVRASSWLW